MSSRGHIVDYLRYKLGLDDTDFNAGAVRTEKRIGGLTGKFSKLTKVIGAGAAALGLWKLTDFIKDATLTAARTEALGTIVQQVGQAAGYSAGYIEDVTEKIKAMGITTQVARTSIVRFIQSELDLGLAAKLARTAQDLASISGQNSSQALETFIQAIAAMRPRLLKQFGIVEDLNVLYARTAKELGKVSTQLTEHEKKMSLINRIFEQGRKVAGSYEAAMGDVGKQLTSLPRYFEELQNAIGKNFLPVLGEGVSILTKSLKSWRELLTDDFTLMSEKIVKSEVKMLALKDKLPGLVAEFEALRDKTGRTAEETVKLYEIQDKIDTLAPGLIEDINAEGIAYALTGESLKDYIDELEVLNEWRKVAQQFDRSAQFAALRDELTYLNELKDILTGWEGHSPLLEEATQGTAHPLFTYEQLIDRIKEIGREMATLTKEMEEDGEVAKSTFKAGSDGAKEMSDKLKELMHDAKLKIVPDIEFPGIDNLDDMLDDLDTQFATGFIDEDTFRQSLKAIEDLLCDFGFRYTKEWLKIHRRLVSITDETTTFIKQDWEEVADDITEFLGGIEWSTLDDMPDKWGDAADSARNYGYILSGLLANSNEQAAQLVDTLANAFAGFAEGGPLGFVSGFASVFQGIIDVLTSSNRELVASQYDLRMSIVDWIDAVQAMTVKEQTAAQQLLEDWVAEGPEGIGGMSSTAYEHLLPIWTEMLAQVGIAVPDGIAQADFWKWLNDTLQGLDITVADLGAAFSASNMAEFSNVLVDTANLTYQQGVKLIEYWAEIFDLTYEQQLELYGILGDALESSGNITWDERMDIGTKMDRLIELAEEEKAAGGNEQTQISRSIAKITERQADSLVALLQTIDFNIRDIGQQIVDKLSEFLNTGGGLAAPALAGGGTSVTFTGDFHFNNQSAKEAAAGLVYEVNNQIRAQGRVYVQ